MNPRSNNKPIPRRRAGFILPFALTVTAVSAITAVMLISYFNNFSRYAHRAGAQTRCRLAAQSVIEQTKIAIQNRFKEESPALIRTDPMMVSTFCDWFATLNNSASTNTTVSAQGGLEEGGHTIKSPVKFDDCVVYVGILPNTAVTNASEAILPIAATAELTLSDKQRVSVTILEQVRFYAGQNQVFNYAYFANNYGWMNSNSDGDLFHINGDFRANGNVSINGSVVNGFIYAAANDKIGAPDYWGNPSGVSGNADVDCRHWSASYYHSNATKDMRPTDPIKTGGESWLGGYDAPTTTTSNQGQTYLASRNQTGTRSGTAEAPLISQGLDPIEMPMISDLAGYIKYAEQQKGTLKCPQYTFKDSTGATKTVGQKQVNAHYAGTGPSGDVNLADYGALVLYGASKDSAVEINGPVVVDSDVIISGYIKGTGVIYSGRNIHVLGNVTYVNGPDWSSVNKGSGSVATSTNANKDKDLVCFIAKGNVVIGNCSTDDWLNSVRSYISNDEAKYNTSQHDCDPSDKDIGYDTKFGGNYTVEEKTGSKAKVRVETEKVESGSYWNGYTNVKTYQDKKVLKTKNNRKYYETVCDDAILSTFNKSNPNHLDGVFYNNHCIMGTVGDNSYNNMTIFGSLVCRNEALLVTTKGKMMFNWDNRLREGSPSHIAGLPLPRGLQTPHTYTWQEAPNDVNPIYASQSRALNER